MEITATATQESNSNLFWGVSGENWDFWLIISVVAAALAAGAIGVTTIGSINAHKREAAEAERKLSEFKSLMDAQVSSANESAAKAVAEVETARAAAAVANQAAAEASLKAETERFERLKLEEKLAPRSLSADEITGLAAKLASAKDAEIDIISYEYSGGDIVFLTLQIEKMFNIAEAKPIVFTPFPGSGWARGVVVCLVENSPPERENLANEIVAAFNAIGIASGRGPSFKKTDPLAGAYNGPTGVSPRQKIRVLVGSKP